VACEPDLLIADEPTTALDVTIQAQVLDVLEEIQQRTSSAILLITHDLGVVAGMADRVLVMYGGKPVETGSVSDIFYRSHHPYTLGLLASLPRVDGDEGERLRPIEGSPPSLIDLPPGCSFHPRCPFARLPEPCAVDEPALREVGASAGVDRRAACHFAEEVASVSPVELRREVGSSPAPAGPGEPR
jgi:oligopeptide/dipeptide ABC transporter ATP-binding protein